MQQPRNKPTPSSPAFTLFELLIVLTLLIGVAAVVLPAALDRGLGDLLDDTQLRIDASLLDAQREARRSGRTVQLVLRSEPSAVESEILITPWPTVTPETNGNADPFWDSQDAGPDSVPARQDGVSSSALEPETTSNTVLAYVLPDGTVVSAAAVLVLNLDGVSHDLLINAGSVSSTLTVSAIQDAEPGIAEAQVGFPEDEWEGGTP